MICVNDVILPILQQERERLRQSLQELRTLARNRHDNIIPLYGFSSDGPEPCLVYQFMANGSLEDRILCRVSVSRRAIYRIPRVIAEVDGGSLLAPALVDRAGHLPRALLPPHDRPDSDYPRGREEREYPS